jgi:hypothetical protein
MDFSYILKQVFLSGSDTHLAPQIFKVWVGDGPLKLCSTGEVLAALPQQDIVFCGAKKRSKLTVRHAIVFMS